MDSLLTQPILLLGASAASELGAQVATVVISFAIVVAILYAVAWKPVLKLLDDRRAEIEKTFDDIDRKTAETTAKLKDYEERLRRIDDEARERLNKAVDEGRRMAAELIDKARADADDIAEKARAAMALEIESARITLRRDAAEMALAAAGKLLETEMDDQRHRALVDNFLAEAQRANLS